MPPAYDFALKEGDTHSTWEYTLRDRDGNAIDVSGVNGVKLTVTAPDGTTAVDAASATLVDAPNGVVSYTFAETDLTTPGVHDAEWEIEHTASDVEYVPYDRMLSVYVASNL